ncbi:MAG: hypothetical protein KZQ73_00500, partial [Candidatus Thiodiazotropha sp. (ex Semelilucina semeliformis)]|nr:hypothetical protein [Candidatus Thiodiazotropha sp. (ex Semelilucina semeliformis)]
MIIISSSRQQINYPTPRIVIAVFPVVSHGLAPDSALCLVGKSHLEDSTMLGSDKAIVGALAILVVG